MKAIPFTAATVFRLKPGAVDPATLETALAKRPYQACTAGQVLSAGWVEAVPSLGLAGCTMDGQTLLALHVETKTVPGSALQAELDKRVKEIEDSQGRKVGRKERRDLKEAIVEGLLSRARPSYKTIGVWIDTRDNWLIVGSTSANVVDLVTETLSKTLEAPACGPLRTNRSAGGVMTEWLSTEEAPEGLSVDMDCTLKGPEGQSVRFTKHSLDGQVKVHLEQGKWPVALGLTFKDRLSFVLTEKAELKRIAYLDILIEQHAEEMETCEDMATAKKADMIFMGGQFRELLPALVEHLGGEAAA